MSEEVCVRARVLVRENLRESGSCGVVEVMCEKVRVKCVCVMTTHHTCVHNPALTQSPYQYVYRSATHNHHDLVTHKHTLHGSALTFSHTQKFGATPPTSTYVSALKNVKVVVGLPVTFACNHPTLPRCYVR